MNIRKLMIAAGLPVGTVGRGGTTAGVDGAVFEEVATAESYGHIKFPEIREETLDGTHASASCDIGRPCRFLRIMQS